MKLFIYEHITSGALIDEPLPTSLAREGNDMLVAIVQDLIQLSNIELIILRDARLEPLSELVNDSLHHIDTIHDAATFHKHYHDALNHADMVLAIAPETDGILNQVQQQVLDSNTRLLASKTMAIQICGDKYQCHQQLTAHDFLSPKTIKANEWASKPFNSPSGFIIKPQDGAGCIDTFLLQNRESLESWLLSHPDLIDKMIIQAYIDGEVISLSVLSDNTESRVLAINQQHIRFDNEKVSFLGSTVNGVNESEFSLAQADEISSKIHQAIPGLWGFIGIDLIIHQDKAFVMDINPRLTTSYIGLGQSLNANPTQLLFSMMEKGLSALPKDFQRQAVEVML